MTKMSQFLVIIPSKEITNIILELRNQIMHEGFGEFDQRINVIPHITITYLEEELTNENGPNLFKNLDLVALPNFFTVNNRGVVNWDRKIVALFNPLDLTNLVENYRKVFEESSIKVNYNYEHLYGKTIGDHMKVAREIKPEKLEETLNLARKILPQQIPIERLALINYEGKEQDILWQKYL